jgi:hypothetical protein
LRGNTEKILDEAHEKDNPTVIGENFQPLYKRFPEIEEVRGGVGKVIFEVLSLTEKDLQSTIETPKGEVVPKEEIRGFARFPIETKHRIAETLGYKDGYELSIRERAMIDAIAEAINMKEGTDFTVGAEEGKEQEGNKIILMYRGSRNPGTTPQDPYTAAAIQTVLKYVYGIDIPKENVYSSPKGSQTAHMEFLNDLRNAGVCIWAISGTAKSAEFKLKLGFNAKAISADEDTLVFFDTPRIRKEIAEEKGIGLKEIDDIVTKKGINGNKALKDGEVELVTQVEDIFTGLNPNKVNTIVVDEGTYPHLWLIDKIVKGSENKGIKDVYIQVGDRWQYIKNGKVQDGTLSLEEIKVIAKEFPEGESAVLVYDVGGRYGTNIPGRKGEAGANGNMKQFSLLNPRTRMEDANQILARLRNKNERAIFMLVTEQEKAGKFGGKDALSVDEAFDLFTGNEAIEGRRDNWDTQNELIGQSVINWLGNIQDAERAIDNSGAVKKANELKDKWQESERIATLEVGTLQNTDTALLMKLNHAQKFVNEAADRLSKVVESPEGKSLVDEAKTDKLFEKINYKPEGEKITGFGMAGAKNPKQLYELMSQHVSRSDFPEWVHPGAARMSWKGVATTEGLKNSIRGASIAETKETERYINKFIGNLKKVGLIEGKGQNEQLTLKAKELLPLIVALETMSREELDSLAELILELKKDIILDSLVREDLKVSAGKISSKAEAIPVVNTIVNGKQKVLRKQLDGLLKEEEALSKLKEDGDQVSPLYVALSFWSLANTGLLKPEVLETLEKQGVVIKSEDIENLDYIEIEIDGEVKVIFTAPVADSNTGYLARESNNMEGYSPIDLEEAEEIKADLLEYVSNVEAIGGFEVLDNLVKQASIKEMNILGASDKEIKSWLVKAEGLKGKEVKKFLNNEYSKEIILRLIKETEGNPANLRNSLALVIKMDKELEIQDNQLHLPVVNKEEIKLRKVALTPEIVKIEFYKEAKKFGFDNQKIEKIIKVIDEDITEEPITYSFAKYIENKIGKDVGIPTLVAKLMAEEVRKGNLDDSFGLGTFSKSAIKAVAEECGLDLAVFYANEIKDTGAIDTPTLIIAGNRNAVIAIPKSDGKFMLIDYDGEKEVSRAELEEKINELKKASLQPLEIINRISIKEVEGKVVFVANEENNISAQAFADFLNEQYEGDLASIEQAERILAFLKDPSNIRFYSQLSQKGIRHWEAVYGPKAYNAVLKLESLSLENTADRKITTWDIKNYLLVKGLDYSVIEKAISSFKENGGIDNKGIVTEEGKIILAAIQQGITETKELNEDAKVRIFASWLISFRGIENDEAKFEFTTEDGRKEAQKFSVRGYRLKLYTYQALSERSQLNSENIKKVNEILKILSQDISASILTSSLVKSISEKTGIEDENKILAEIIAVEIELGNIEDNSTPFASTATLKRLAERYDVGEEFIQVIEQITTENLIQRNSNLIKDTDKIIQEYPEPAANIPMSESQPREMSVTVGGREFSTRRLTSAWEKFISGKPLTQEEAFLVLDYIEITREMDSEFLLPWINAPPIVYKSISTYAQSGITAKIGRAHV